MRDFAKMKGDYPDPGHDAGDFRAGATVAVEVQLHSGDFTGKKKTEAYSFCLLGVYLIDKTETAMVLTP